MLACNASLVVELSLDRIGEDAGAALGDEELIRGGGELVVGDD